MDNENSIRVDVEELIEKLNFILEDEFTTVELKIVADEYTSELEVNAVGIENESPVGFGSLQQIDDEMF